MPKILPEDATLAEVLDTLAKPLDYVCGALGHLHQCQKMHCNAEMLIGVTGKGISPCYRIRYVDQAGTIQVFDTFSGDTHRSLSEEGQPIEGGLSWSIKALPLAEVAELRGTLKG